MTLRPIRTRLGRAALLVVLAAPALPTYAQQIAQTAQVKKSLTLEDIWAKRDFFAVAPEGTNWLKDGRHYTALVGDEKNKTQDIVRFDITTGQPVNTLVEGESLRGPVGPLEIDGYSFSSDESKLLLTTEQEPIYRRSSKANFYLYDLGSKELKPVSTGGKQMYATFSPNGERVAFVRENNVYYVDVKGGQEHKVTTDGVVNQRINGALDWVYEEEFEFAVGFGWSPDGSKLAFYTFDESRVPEYAMQQWGKLYPTSYVYKYPKAGEVNSILGVKVYDLAKNQTVTLDTGKEPDQYLPRMKWTQNSNLVAVQRLNRLQNKLELLHCNATTGQSSVVLTETDKAYVEVTDDLTYLKDGKQFVWSSERDGYKHLYLYSFDGQKNQQLTKGAWDVTDFYGVDEARDLVYYAAAQPHPRERQLYCVGLKGKTPQRLSQGAGTHEGAFSPTFSYYFDTHSSFGTPPVTTLFDATGKTPRQIKVVEDNAELKQRLSELRISPVEFIEVPLPSDAKTKLNGWMLKPTNFDPAKKYPAILYVYGGPGSQTGQDEWGGANYYWFQILAEQGYVIISVDNRGTGARGAAFKKATYLNLGKLEIEDQMDVARWAGNQPYIDKTRIGMWGWSYGGYMTTLAMTKGADLFKTGVAVAPGTSWRFYDTVYTERFLRTPQENPAGYDENSPLSHVNKLKGNFLMIAGTGDDNVHFQNAVALEDALIKANKQFSSFFYPNRNHGIYGGVTRLHLYRMMTDYFVKNL